ncbi:sel1 repeat family protein [Psychrobacter sp. SCQQ22]|uniref:tetratricopeptide repeat protein n=1 Tax=Psychrobacter sp. SCQQ22 TaxID=2792059 RepID=UPI0018CF1EDA|nr:tetratricopeptide repeat protein [Psychrobacter sp. SCQQ22]MBH0086014.1 sel1 repeat family protein [Psychrobacter sp. SCQQ22]
MKISILKLKSTLKIVLFSIVLASFSPLAQASNSAASQVLIDDGSIATQYEIGAMYAAGEKVPQDYAKAAEWFHKAADQGDAVAQWNLGAMYNSGVGVKQNSFKAFQWYKKAANQGELMSQYFLGVMYEHGRGTERDYDKAYEWYQKTAVQIKATLQDNFDYYYDNDTATSYANIAALNLLKKSTSQNNLGVMYLKGNGVPQDYDKEFKLLQKSAIQNNSYAQRNMGMLYMSGDGVDQDREQAMKWFHEACGNDDPMSCNIYEALFLMDYEVIASLVMSLEN